MLQLTVLHFDPANLTVSLNRASFSPFAVIMSYVRRHDASGLSPMNLITSLTVDD